MAMSLREMIDHARLATLVDGEGSIFINGWVERTATGTPRLSVTNTEVSIIKWLLENFGGRLGHYRDGNRKHKIRMIWYVQGKEACLLLDKFRGWMISDRKRRVAFLVMSFYNDGERRERQINAGRWKPLLPREKERRREIYKEVRLLNRRGLLPNEYIQADLREELAKYITPEMLNRWKRGE